VGRCDDEAPGARAGLKQPLNRVVDRSVTGPGSIRDSTGADGSARSAASRSSPWRTPSASSTRQWSWPAARTRRAASPMALPSQQLGTFPPRKVPGVGARGAGALARKAVGEPVDLAGGVVVDARHAEALEARGGARAHVADPVVAVDDHRAGRVERTRRLGADLLERQAGPLGSRRPVCHQLWLLPLGALHGAGDLHPR
jgi:hypothetical protein